VDFGFQFFGFRVNFLRYSPVGREACLSICLSVCPRAARADHVYVFFFLSLLSSWKRSDGSLFTSREREKEWGVDICLNRLLAVYRPFTLSWSLCLSFIFHLFILFHGRCLVSTSLSALCSLLSALCSRPRSFCPPGLIPLGSLTRSRACMDLCMHPSIFLLYPDPPFIYFLSFGRALLLSMCI
jgi:hypothetical protein